jgi:hypothetical protein
MNKTIVSLATLTALGLGVSQAQATTTLQAYGSASQGWKLESQITSTGGIRSLDPSGVYTITFTNSTTRNTVGYYYKTLASYLTNLTGAKFVISSTNMATGAGCPTSIYHKIVVNLKYRPISTPGFSQTMPCYNTANDSEYGAWINIDSEYWSHPGWFSGKTYQSAYDYAMIWNVNAHELGHAIGLDHPNYTSGSTLLAGKCAKDSSGYMPIMCSPNSGPHAGSGVNYTSMDKAGFKQLVANFTLKPLSTVMKPASVPHGAISTTTN